MTKPPNLTYLRPRSPQRAGMRKNHGCSASVSRGWFIIRKGVVAHGTCFFPLLQVNFGRESECVMDACEDRLNELHPHSVKLILPYIRAFKGEVRASGSERVERSR